MVPSVAVRLLTGYAAGLVLGSAIPLGYDLELARPPARRYPLEQIARDPELAHSRARCGPCEDGIPSNSGRSSGWSAMRL